LSKSVIASFTVSLAGVTFWVDAQVFCSQAHGLAWCGPLDWRFDAVGSVLDQARNDSNITRNCHEPQNSAFAFLFARRAGCRCKNLCALTRACRGSTADAHAVKATEQTMVPAAVDRRWRIALAGSVLALVMVVGIYAAVGFWWVPRLIAKDLPPWLAQRYGLQLTLGPVDFNPFHFSLQAKNVRIRSSDGAPLLRAESLAVGYTPSGLLHRTWTFDHVTVSGLHLDLVLAKDGKLNLVKLLDRLTPPATQPSAAPPRITLDRFTLSQGSMLFSDMRGPTPASVSVGSISFSAQGVSTVPGQKATQTLTATLPDGATLDAQGALVLEPALSAQGHFSLQGAQAKNWLPFARNDFRIERVEGSVSATSNYRYDVAQGLQLDDLAIHVADLLLEASGVQAPLIAMKKIDATGGKLELVRGNASFSRVALAQGNASVAIAGDGQVGWAELLLPASATAPATTATAAPGPDWHFAVSALLLDRVGLAYDDRQRQPPLVANIGSLDGDLQLAITTGLHTAVLAEKVAMTAHKLALPAPGTGRPALKIDSVTVGGGGFDLAARRFAAQEVSIQGGNVAAGRDADGSLDWSRRFAPARGGKPAPAGANVGWHYDIAKASVNGVGIALTDRSLTPAFAYDLRIESATAQHLTNGGQDPVRFEATVSARQGGTLHAKGIVAANGAALKASLQIDQLALPPFAPLAKHSTGFDVTGGPLTLAADLHDAKGLVVDLLDLDLPNFVLRRQTGTEPLFAAAQVQMHGGQVDVAKRQVVIAQLKIADGAARARMQPNGRLDWQAAADRPSAPRPAAAAAPSAAWNVRIEALQLSQMAAHYADLGSPKPLRVDVDRLDLGMALQLSTGGASTQVVAQDVRAQARAASLSVDAGKPPALAFASATLGGGTFDLSARRVAADRLALTGGDTAIVRDAQGRIALLDSLASAAPPPTPAPSVPAKQVSPWEYALGNLHVKDFRVQAEDQSFSPSLTLDGKVDATLEHLANQGPASFDATLSLAEGGGSLQATGSVTPAGGNLQAHLIAKALALSPLQPLLSRYTTLALRSGQAGSDLAIQYDPGAREALRASGQLHIDQLTLDEGVQGTRFLALDQLDATQINFSSDGPRLNIGELDLLGPDTRIAIAKDRRVNLAQVVKHGGDEAARAAAKPPSATAPAPVAATATAPGFELDVQRVRIHAGSVDFSDQSLVLPFATKVTAIDATIAGISNDGTRRADVQARGSIQTYGSASVDGNIVLFDPRRYTDLRVKFNNVMVQPFSPYTATFAGRKVQSGKLWLDLEYKIDQGKLLGKNDVRLDHFVLGERVESPSASDLPLNLAVSLLTDSKGEIKLSIPVRGDLENPHFDIGNTIAHAFGNTIGRIVTAPFRLLGRLFGGGSSLDDSIDFAPGSAALAPAQREKLDALTRALTERPLLRLVVSAPYDVQADTLALKRDEVRRELATRLKLPAPSDTTSSLVAFDEPATRAALRAMRAQQNGQDAAASVLSPASSAIDRAAYEAMFENIAAHQPLGAGATRILATRRAEAIAQFLDGKGIARARVQTGQVESVPISEAGTVDARLQVSAGQP
jgi:hypothetical protein